jgi:hypothetical protein
MELIARFKALVFEFSDKPIEQIQAYLDIASEQVTNSGLSEIQRDTLIVWLAGHMATIALHNFQAGGSVSSISEGKLSVSYNMVTAKDSLDTTRCGLEYKDLCRKYIRYIPKTIWI